MSEEIYTMLTDLFIDFFFPQLMNLIVLQLYMSKY